MELESDWRERYFLSRGHWLSDHQVRILQEGPESLGEEKLLSLMKSNWEFEKMLQEEGYEL